MTGTQIFELGSALIMEKTGEDPDSAYFTPMFLTIALQECLPYENAIRAAAGDEELEEAPYVEDLTTTIDYNNKITRVALPYLLASHFFRDNNDAYHEQQFFSLYQSTVLDSVPYIVGTVSDYYNNSEDDDE